MRLLKPSWVSHAGNPIFSLDIHPDGSRLATGGQGEDSGRIVIWNMAPIINDEDEKDDSVPKMLCQLDNHLACVNCVRWSNSGKYLASGGDDKVLMIWRTNRYAAGTTVFGSGGKVNIEQWRCVSTLRGHSGDILDLAWSPHDAWLASCSVDNTVVVWNANKFPEILSVLRGHSGLVKGVSWDPVGKYLASQSDDKSLFVWRTVDWQQEASITEPFEECGGTTHVLRLSWSPDGQYLVSAHAMNNSGPTAQIIERDGWKTEKDFVGHRKAITVAKFNPHILSKVCKDSSKVQHYCCCAIGSRDRSLSIWLTALKRPLVVVHDLFANSVLDISWSRRGHQLTVCSWDGTIAYVDFSEEEIGHPLSPEEESVVHQKMYGKSLAMNNRMDSVTAVIENPEMLKLKEQQKEKEMNEEQKVKQDMVRASVTAKGPINKQIETRTADGRRRITPMFIAPAPDLGDVPLPFNSKTQPTFSSSTESKSRIIIEKRNEMAAAAAAAAALTTKTNGTSESQEKCKSMQSSPNKSAAASPSAVEPAAPPVSVPNGISPSESSNKPLPNAVVSPVSTTEPIKPIIPEKNDKVLDKSKEVKVVKPPETNLSLKRKEMEEMVVKPAKRRPGRPPLAEKLAAAANASPKNVPVPAPVVDREPRDTNRAVHGTLHLPALKADKVLSIQIPSPEGPLLLEMENNIQASSSVTVQKLKCSRAGTLSWEVLLASKGVAIAGSSHAVAVVCEDNSLSVFSPLGQRVFPSIVLPSSISRILCSNYFVMVLTTKAHIYVWDVKNQRIIVKNETLNPIMSGGPSDVTIVSCSLTDHGSPVISLSTGKAYVFNSCMACWMMVSNADDVLQHCSDHQQHMPTQTLFNGTAPPLATLQAQGKRPSQQVFRLFRSLPAMQQTGTLSYLDSQLASALSLHSRKEYKFWLLTLTRYLVQEGFEVRLREVCNSLLGPIVKTKSSWDPYILGLHKHDLLEEILPVIGSNLRLQRLFTEYQEQLEMVKT